MTEATIVASALPERRRVAALAALALAALGPVYFGVDAAGLVGAVFLAALAVLTVKDLEDRRIPNAIVLPVAGIVLVATALLHPGRAAESILAALAAGAFLLIPSLISRGVGMLVQITAVDERLMEKVRIPEGEAEPGRERGGGADVDAALAGRVT